jgi:hypothetical protein
VNLWGGVYSAGTRRLSSRSWGKKANGYLKTPDQDTAVHLAARARKSDRVSALLKHLRDQRINEPGKDDVTVLDIAAENRDRKTAAALLQNPGCALKVCIIDRSLEDWAFQEEATLGIVKMKLMERHYHDRCCICRSRTECPLDGCPSWRLCGC